ncbi:MAG: hypothetical protein H6R14_128 [Proteobacteria bacterium]|nr:hypothetical protein [Pseudomonadota bacterium]
MRSTRATAAVARLNQRSEGRHFVMVMTGDGLFLLRERTPQGELEASPALPLDDFVKAVNALGPQEVPRVTKADAAFARQLARKR